MSYQRDFYGTTYTIPARRETGWSSWVTDLLIALTERLTSTPQALVADTTATTIDATDGHNVSLDLQSPTAITITNLEDGDRLVIRIQQSNNYVVTWADTILWRGSTEPVITIGSGKVDVVTLYMDPDLGLIGDYGQNYGVP